MNSITVSPLSPAGTPTPLRMDDPAKVRDAARQFEALLIGQILHSVRESGSGWLGAPGDSSSDCATDFAEQQFAAVMAQAGGLGIAHMVERGLKAPSPPQERSSPAPGFPHPDRSSGSTSLVPKSSAQ